MCLHRLSIVCHFNTNGDFKLIIANHVPFLFYYELQIIFKVPGAAEAGGAGGARAPPPPPPTFWHRKKMGRRRRKKGKESVHPVPDRDVYMYKQISPSNCSKMYKTPELPGAPLDPIRFELVAQALPHN